MYTMNSSEIRTDSSIALLLLKTKTKELQTCGKLLFNAEVGKM